MKKIIATQLLSMVMVAQMFGAAEQAKINQQALQNAAHYLALMIDQGYSICQTKYTFQDQNGLRIQHKFTSCETALQYIRECKNEYNLTICLNMKLQKSDDSVLPSFTTKWLSSDQAVLLLEEAITKQKEIK